MIRTSRSLTKSGPGEWKIVEEMKREHDPEKTRGLVATNRRPSAFCKEAKRSFHDSLSVRPSSLFIFSNLIPSLRSLPTWPDLVERIWVSWNLNVVIVVQPMFPH
jgi:hypothetical protein